jgi:hypothetical protein
VRLNVRALGMTVDEFLALVDKGGARDLLAKLGYPGSVHPLIAGRLSPEILKSMSDDDPARLLNDTVVLGYPDERTTDAAGAAILQSGLAVTVERNRGERFLADPLASQNWLTPEPRVPDPDMRVIMPEAEMTRQVFAAAEAEFNAPIRDEWGRVRYIIDLDDAATEDYQGRKAPNDGFPDYLKPETRLLAREMAAQYRFEPVSLTSWVGHSITAYLTDDQVALLKRDARVTAITADHRIRPSAQVWQDSGRTAWGVVAMGPQTVPGNSIPVYVLDTGVSNHLDLPYLTRAPILSNTATPTQSTKSIGCYSHATHVAGIIGGVGATLPAVAGSTGIVKGIPIVSVSVASVLPAIGTSDC